MDWTLRTELLFGADGLAALQAARVTVVGVGGVGAYAAEMLVRSGVGHLTVIDNDEVGESNINRQLLALHSTVGRPKVEVLKERLLDINPSLDLSAVREYVNEQNVASVVPTEGFVVDAIDTLSPKISLIQHCLKNGLHLVSAMGAGAKTDATMIRVADISKTRECPLAHMLRKRLHKLGIFSGFDAVFSLEKPRENAVVLEESRNKKSQVGTVSYMPSVMGCVCAQVVIERIVGIR